MSENKNLIGTNVSGEEWLAKGDDLRINKYMPREAIECYKTAIARLDLPVDRCRFAKHMIGVCYAMLHAYQTAVTWYEQALLHADSLERANIYRDMADSYRAMRMYHDAEMHLNDAMKLLSYIDNPTEMGATLGFLARSASDQGFYEAALIDYAGADDLLMENNEQLALYNRLHWASTLSLAGHGLESRVLALKCLLMCKKYGAKPHYVRAAAIFVGGWWLESFAKKFQSKKLKL